VAQVGAPVTPYAAPRNALDNESSTIATTNTFQAVFPSNLNRQGCTIQNNGTNSMWVFFGATASATKGTSVVLAAGQAAYCGSGLLTYQGVVAITGTMGDAFYAAGQ
jgi:hypothetical protein